ncbi:MAG: hypothetical protein NZ937_09775, partial [Armatimonadetes bacterium]|nr:hypothetical protein [Armatimonadota bacterium]
KLCQLHHWLFPFAFAQTELVRTLLSLYRDHALPVSWHKHSASHESSISAITLLLCPLQELGELGPDVRDIYDGFEILRGDSTPTPFPAFWGHKAEAVMIMKQRPNAYLSPLYKAREKRPLRNAELLWSRAGEILIAMRMRLNTQRLVSVLLPEPVLSNVWWPMRLHEGLSEEMTKALLLWFNSVIGVLLLIGSRVETEGAWVAFKKPTLHVLPVLDVRRLTQQQLKHLADTFDSCSE